MISTIINTNCLYSLSIRAFLFSNESQSGSLKHHLNMERLLHFPFRQRTHHTCMPHLPLLLMTFLLPNSFSIFPSCHCQQTSFIFFSYCFLPNLILCLWGVELRSWWIFCWGWEVVRSVVLERENILYKGPKSHK